MEIQTGIASSGGSLAKQTRLDTHMYSNRNYKKNPAVRKDERNERKSVL